MTDDSTQNARDGNPSVGEFPSPTSSTPFSSWAGAASRRWRGGALHLVRLAFFAGIVTLIALQARKEQSRRLDGESAGPELADALLFFPAGLEWGETDAVTGARRLVDAQGNLVGFVVQTSPQGDRIIGFSGPTNLLLAFDPDGILLGAEILSSQDTADHVQAIRDDGRYRNWWKGRSWSEIAGTTRVDAVSGATLTSLAMAQAVVARLGGTAPSLKFPDPPTVVDAVRLFPEAAGLESSSGSKGSWSVYDNGGAVLGVLHTTSPAADDIIGYQGPTETLVAVSPAGRVLKTATRRSYDNAPYVGYLDEDWSWPELFAGRSLEEVSRIDLAAAGIEGVSGATMTSMAVARGVIAMAQDATRPVERSRPEIRPLSWSPTWRDGSTAAVVVIGLVIASTRLRGLAAVRIPYQLLLIAVLGFANGDMLSQAMLVGWTKHGLPWTSAPRLVLLAAVAFTFPTLTRRNVYCSHLCPHGAVQQLLLPKGKRRRHSGRRWGRMLALLPAGLMGLVVVTALTNLSVNLVGIEPFDAYLFRIAGWGTLTVAAVGLIASLFVPMAYCRYGCPTGALLDYTRRHGRSDRWSRADTFAAALLAFSALWWWFA